MAPSISLLGRLVKADGESLGVGDLHVVTYLHLVQVLRIPSLDGYGVSLRSLDRCRLSCLVDRDNGRGHADLLRDGTRGRLPGFGRHDRLLSTRPRRALARLLHL